MSPSSGSARRALVRETWQTLYPPDPLRYELDIEYRFVLANPGALVDNVTRENSTYGDLIVLSHLEEGPDIANTVKTVEFYKSLRNSSDTPLFISKVDDDSFVCVPCFYSEFLAAHLHPPERNLVVGRELGTGWTVPYPGGQMYTLSGDLALRLADQHDVSPITDTAEDWLIGRLIADANITAMFKWMDSRKAFDYDPAVLDATAWSHAVLPGAVNPHKMKVEEDYRVVAALFNGYGLDLGKVPDL
jgi:hypothetical protein